MRLGRIMGVILSFLAVMYLMNNYIEKNNSQEPNNSIELIGDIGYVEKNNLNLENNDYEVMEFKNNYNYPVEISADSISITCKGVGNTKEDDEYLVSNNFKINAYFSKELNGIKEKSLIINKKEKVYIYVISEYVGEVYPSNEVACDYNINILAA